MGQVSRSRIERIIRDVGARMRVRARARKGVARRVVNNITEITSSCERTNVSEYVRHARDFSRDVTV